MALVWCQQGVRQQRIEEGAADFQPMIQKNGEIVLQVVSNLFRGTSEGGMEDCKRLGVGNGGVAGRSLFPAEGDSEDLCAKAIEGGCFDIKAEAVLLFQLPGEFETLGVGVGQGVGGFYVLD